MVEGSQKHNYGFFAESFRWTVDVYMVTGDLKIYAIESVRGDIAYTASVTPLRLGGLSNPNVGTITLSIARPAQVKPRRVLLEIGLTTLDYPERMRWRLWFDGIAVSREYRPKSIAKLPDAEGYYSKTVFDVTPIYTPSDIHKVTIAYEGSNPIVVDHVGILAVYDLPDAHVSFAFLSGALALNPQSSYRVMLELPNVPEEATHTVLRAVIGLQQKDSSVAFEANGKIVHRVSGFMGVDETVVEALPVSSRYTLGIIHERGSKHVRVSTLILAVARRSLPDIHAEVAEREDDKVVLKLVNRGLSKPDKLMVLVITPGEGIERVEVEPLAPGNEKIIEVKVPEGRRATLRLVWVKHGKPYQRDYRL